MIEKKMKNVYVVGSINTDLVIKAPYMPVSGETLTGEGFFKRAQIKRSRRLAWAQT